MALTPEDLAKSAATMVVASGNADYSGRCRLMGATVQAADASTLSIFDAATAAGTAVIKLGAGAGLSATVWFGPQGIRFATGISTASTGTSPVKQVFYIPDA